MGATLLLVSSALALQAAGPQDPGGWNAAKWGMQPQEVRSLFKGMKTPKNAFAMSGQPVVKLELRKTMVNGIQCDVQFAFHAASGLAQVNVLPRKQDEATFEALKGLLSRELGDGATSEEGIRSMVRWNFATTRVQLFYEDPLRDPMVRANRDRLPYLTPPAVILTYYRPSEQ